MVRLQNCIVLSTLFLLLFSVVVQCGPHGNLGESSVYEKLVELATNKCTYLQSSALLFNDSLQFLKECTYKRMTAENFSIVSMNNFKELHCLLYYETFEWLCLYGQEARVPSILKAAEKKVAIKEIGAVCDALRTFYTSHSRSKIASIMRMNGACEAICPIFFSKLVTVSCQWAALMALATGGQAISPKFPNPAVESAQLTAEANLAPEVTISTQVVGDLNVGTGIAEPIANGQTLEKEKPGGNHDQSVSTAKKVSSQGETVLSVEQKVKPVPPLPHSSNPMASDTHQNTPPPMKLTTNNEGQSSQEVMKLGQDQVVLGQNQSLSQAAVQEAVEGQAAAKVSTTESSADNFNQGDTLPPKMVLDNKKPMENMSERTVADPHKDAALSSPIDDADKLEKDEAPYNQDPGDGNPAFDGDDEEVQPPLPNEKPHSTNADNDLMSISEDDLPSNDSYFFSYFMMFCILFAMGYVGYHNKQKILALVLEGRRGRRQPRRRPNSANYHKLDSNLEEAVTSSCDKTTSNVIY